ncbi:MAG: response regulator transcription factor [Candidatus Obscuribacterales bacterium]|nr:response regulator transcription factor [Candidatus Obscuribacterales bacterium]
MFEVNIVDSGNEHDSRLLKLLHAASYPVRLLDDWPDPAQLEKNGGVILAWHDVGDAIDSLIRYRMQGGIIPVILISAKQLTTVGRIRMYSAGADECITSVWEKNELVAILESFARRPFIRRGNTILLGGLTINLVDQVVETNDDTIHLTSAEFRILEFLALHPRCAFSASALLERLWSRPEAVFEDTVRSHIKNIRRKVDSPGSQSVIRTIAGRGYMIENSCP